MFGAIPASIWIEAGRRQGVMTQLELDLGCPPWYFIKPEYLTDVHETLSYCSPDGKTYGSHGTVGHPSFTKLRNHLESRGYIHTVRNSSNGDTVLEPFYLNNYLFLPGEKFSCAGAIRCCHKQIVNGYNDGKIDPTVKNYRDDYNPEYASYAERLKENKDKGDDWW